MDAPNAPNPANPNAQEPADQNQDQVPIGPAPPQGPIQVVQNIPVQPIPQQVPIQPALLMSCLLLRYSIKIGYGRNPNFQVSQRRMQNPISLAQEIGWRHTIFQKEKR